MSDTAQEKDPSIEEILASIRQIISDDEEEAVEADSTEEPIPAEDEPEEDVLELTDKVEEPEPEPEPEPEDEIEVDLSEQDEEIEDILVEEPAPAPEPPKEVVKEATKKVESSILGDTAATAALEGFTKLARDIQITRNFDGITLEDVVRAQLEPLLREWLDKNLPPMIEVLVEKELEKLSKKALND